MAEPLYYRQKPDYIAASYRVTRLLQELMDILGEQPRSTYRQIGEEYILITEMAVKNAMMKNSRYFDLAPTPSGAIKDNDEVGGTQVSSGDLNK